MFGNGTNVIIIIKIIIIADGALAMQAGPVLGEKVSVLLPVAIYWYGWFDHLKPISIFVRIVCTSSQLASQLLRYIILEAAMKHMVGV